MKIAPLSQTQLGIYVDCLNMRDAGAYNGHFLLTLDNAVDMKKLAAAIEKAVAAHPSIFVRLAERDGETFQEIVAESYHQTVEEMSESDWQKKLSELVTQPLELHGGRLFRFNLVQTEKAKYLLRTTHHVSFDRSAANTFLPTLQKFMKIPTLKLLLKFMTLSTPPTTNPKRVSPKNSLKPKNGTKKLSAALTLRLYPFPTATTKKFPSIPSQRLFRLNIRRSVISAKLVKFPRLP